MAAVGPKGHHVLVELFGCHASACDDLPRVRSALRSAVSALDTEILGDAFHRFSPQGVSGVVLIGSSHVSCHTWPELQYVAVDLYTCGATHPRAAVDLLINAFGATTWVLRDIERGAVNAAPARPFERTDALVAETRFVEPEAHAYALERDVHHSVTPTGQRIDVVDLKGDGRTLFVDGVRHSSAVDEFIHHEWLVHPALHAAMSPKRVLIAGNATGAAAREVLRYRDVEQVVQVDADEALPGVSRAHLPQWSDGAFDDPRFSLVISNLRGYLERNTRPFDAIILDGVPDASSHGQLLPRLAPAGVVASHFGPLHPSRADDLSRAITAWKRTFTHAAFHAAPELGTLFAVGARVPFSARPTALGGTLRAFRPSSAVAPLPRWLEAAVERS